MGYNFDGLNRLKIYITGNYFHSLDITGAISMRIAFATDSFINNIEAVVVQKGHYNDDITKLNYAFLLYRVGGTHRFCFTYGGNSWMWRWYSTSEIVTTQKYYDVAFSYNFSDPNSFKMFVTGGHITGQWESTPTSVKPEKNNRLLHVGAAGDYLAGYAFNGQIYDLALWNVDLHSGELRYITQSKQKYRPLEIRPTGLVFYFPLDRGTGASHFTAITSTNRINPENGAERDLSTGQFYSSGYGDISNEAYRVAYVGERYLMYV